MRSALALIGAAAVASASYSLDVPGYARQDLNDAAINAPVTDNCYTYIQYSLYSNVTDAAELDPARCIQDCEETTAYNAQYLNSRATCRFVNTYILLKDGYSQGQVCAMYTASWDESYATNTGYSYNGSTYSICDSYTYSNITDPGVVGEDCVGGPYQPQPPVCPTSTSIPSTTASIPSYPTTYPSSTFATVTTSSSQPTTTLTPTVILPTPTSTSQSTIVIPTSSSTPVVVPTSSSAPVVVPTSSSTPVAAPTSSAAPSSGGAFQCTGMLSSPECCETNVLDAASLTCTPPSQSFTTREEFRSICAATGATASCCLLPILGQAVDCENV